MSAIAVAVAGSALVGAYMSSQATQNAADAETSAANRATDVSQGNYLQNREDLAPYRAAGANAIGQIGQQLPDINRSFSMADFQADPGYQFRMDEGNKAIERSAAARGGLNSGGTLKALDRYSQGVASDEFGNAYNRFNTDRTNRFNRLAAVAGIGQAGANTTVQAGTNNANNISGNIQAAGNATAAANIAQGNNINSAIGNGMNTWMTSQYLNRTPTSTPQQYGGGASITGPIY